MSSLQSNDTYPCACFSKNCWPFSYSVSQKSAGLTLPISLVFVVPYLEERYVGGHSNF
jgi:hypothetical protein